MIPCSYCGKLLKYPEDRHSLHPRVPCPITWKPWERLDFKATKRGEWWIRFQPLPTYAYLAKHRSGEFQIIPVFAPYVTAPTHPDVWDAVAKRIVDH